MLSIVDDYRCVLVMVGGWHDRNRPGCSGGVMNTCIIKVYKDFPFTVFIMVDINLVEQQIKYSMQR